MAPSAKSPRNDSRPLLHRRPPRHVRKDDGNAFIRDPQGGTAHASDSLAENLAEAYLESATSGEEQGEVWLNEFVPEDIGGPFLEEEEEELAFASSSAEGADTNVDEVDSERAEGEETADSDDAARAAEDEPAPSAPGSATETRR